MALPLYEAATLCFSVLKTPLIATALLWGVHLVRRQTRARPPGPMGLPLIGNVFDLPGSREAESIAALGAKYGETAPLPLGVILLLIRVQETWYI